MTGLVSEAGGGDVRQQGAAGPQWDLAKTREVEMAKYLVVHPVGKEVTREAAAPMGKAAKALSTKDAYWVRSWYAQEEGKLYCEWDAKDGDSVRKVIEKANATLPEGARLPVEGVYEMVMMANSEEFR